MSTEIRQQILRESSAELDIDGLEPHRDTLGHMLSQARLSIDLVTRDLDRRLFDQRPLIDALRRMALDNRRARVRMVVMESGALIRREHRLVSLAQRLPSFFELRLPGPDHRNFNASFVIADGHGIIYRPYATLYQGQACFNDPVRAGELTRQFEALWEAGVPDVNLRQMRI